MKPTITYSRKSSKRQESNTLSNTSPVRKRRKITVEVVQPLAVSPGADRTLKRTRSQSPDEVDQPVAGSSTRHTPTKRFKVEGSDRSSESVDKTKRPRQKPSQTELSKDVGHKASLTIDSLSNPTPPPSRHLSPPSAPSPKVYKTYSRSPHRSHSATSSNPSSPSSIRRTATLPALPLPTPKDIDPLTPKKPARNLSSLFDFSPSSAATPSPGREKGTSINANQGLAKRMLSRSRTESSLENGSAAGASFNSTPSSSLLRKDSTFILPSDIASPSSKRFSTPLKSLQKPSTEHSVSPSPSPSHHAIPAAPTTTYTRTYAGKSRSFLVALPASHIPSLSHPSLDPPDEEETETRESYADLRTRWGVDNSEDDPRPPSPSFSSPGKGGKGKAKQVGAPLPNGMMNDLKSITELRSKGESRRFLDEVGYLFEGLEPKGSITVRRASGLEIVTKLCKADFARKAKAADFLGRAWDTLRAAGAGDGDKILDTILVFFAALVARDPGSLLELAARSDFVPTLFKVLSVADRQRDVLSLFCAGASDAQLRRASVLRTEKPLLTALSNVVAKDSGIFHNGAIISTRTLVSSSLAALPPSLLQPLFLPALRRTLQSELSLIPPRVDAYLSGLSLLPPSSPLSHPDMPSFIHIENCLRLLDSFLLGQWSSSDNEDPIGKEALNGDGLLDGLIALCVTVEILARDNRGLDVRTIEGCLEIAFRVLVNLSHEDNVWCQRLLQNEFTLPLIMRIIVLTQHERSASLVKKEEVEVEFAYTEDDQEAHALDRLCLALGLLTNLVQVTEEAKELARETRIDPSCTAKRNCIGSCHCLHPITGLQCLVRIYLQQLKADDAGANFLRGHMAVLFGLLMRRNQANQRIVLGALPGDSNRAKLNSLIEQARAFVTFYAELTTRLVVVANGREDGDLEAQPSSQHTREHGVDQIVRDEKGETVAKDIIDFLETIRDQQY